MLDAAAVVRPRGWRELGAGDDPPDDPFAAPPPQLAATFKVNAPVKVFPLFSQFPSNALGNQRLLPIDEDAPLLVDVNGDPLLDADAGSRATARTAAGISLISAKRTAPPLPSESGRLAVRSTLSVLRDGVPAATRAQH